MGTSCTFLPSFLSIGILLLLLSGDFCATIIGGHEVTPHSKPYMVLIEGRNLCAGALIAKTWVLTAAHCSEIERVKVILGAHSRTKNESQKQIILIENGTPYPCYDPVTHEGDLQLLKLNKPAALNTNVGTLKLPKNAKDVKPGTVCEVAGWGKTNNKSPNPSDTLREVNVTVIDRKTCNDEKHYAYNPVIGLNMICAGNPKGGRDSCDGDSGSPLICDGVLRGITSFGYLGKCGDPQKPGVYTRLSEKHLVWIAKTMKGVI
ncbi:PREDICTED: granzyme A-like [Elephantulus edwardii]|uniref:granzyme A-like n=1 Tax=Elephantulus edwardii TaxID=28737 RepID=UPI0003F0BCED|nr:PREDICTED: granzyme A-like [Elephantulus edwardii]